MQQATAPFFPYPSCSDSRPVSHPRNTTDTGKFFLFHSEHDLDRLSGCFQLFLRESVFLCIDFINNIRHALIHTRIYGTRSALSDAGDEILLPILFQRFADNSLIVFLCPSVEIHQMILNSTHKSNLSLGFL